MICTRILLCVLLVASCQGQWTQRSGLKFREVTLRLAPSTASVSALAHDAPATYVAPSTRPNPNSSPSLSL